MINESEIKALVSLLDDTDKEVVSHVSEKLLSLGDDAVPLLEEKYFESNNKLKAKIQILISQIQAQNIRYELKKWAESGAADLFHGAWLICKFQYPDLDKSILNNNIDKLKLDAWLELSASQSPLEKVRVINHIMFQKHKLRGNTEIYHDTDNSFINRVLDTKKGNPITLSVIYSIVCQRLNIPVFGVNLPQHFILVYKDSHKFQGQPYNPKQIIKPDFKGEILFYINPFNKGVVFSKWNIDQYLQQLKIQPRPAFYEACSNVDIIIRIIRNLIFAYEKRKETDKSFKLKNILKTMEVYAGKI